MHGALLLVTWIAILWQEQLRERQSQVPGILYNHLSADSVQDACCIIYGVLLNVTHYTCYVISCNSWFILSCINEFPIFLKAFEEWNHGKNVMAPIQTLNTSPIISSMIWYLQASDKSSFPSFCSMRKGTSDPVSIWAGCIETHSSDAIGYAPVFNSSKDSRSLSFTCSIWKLGNCE